MKTKSFLISAAFIFCLGMLNGQGFKPPSGDNAVVYFVRVSPYGASASFDFFHQDRYIGSLSGENYLRYECKAGQHLFWASSRNEDFLTADLKPGGIYIVIADITIGFWKVQVGLIPVSTDDKEWLSRAKGVVNFGAPVKVPQSRIDKKNKKLSKFIPEMLKKYEKDWKFDHNTKHISPEMAIPPEELK